VLVATRVVFITHIHGDHQLGVIKIMLERDLLMQALPVEQRTTLYIVTPSPMMDWMLQYRD
jgi:ribonuclease BN (tRNA processing enzyme)